MSQGTCQRPADRGSAGAAGAGAASTTGSTLRRRPPAAPRSLWGPCYVLTRGSSLGQLANTVPREGGATSTPCSKGKEAFLTHVSRVTDFNPVILQVGKWSPRRVPACPRSQGQALGASKKERPDLPSELGHGPGLTVDPAVLSVCRHILSGSWKATRHPRACPQL